MSIQYKNPVVKKKVEKKSGTPLYTPSENMGYPIIMRFFKILGIEYGKKIKIPINSLIPKRPRNRKSDKNSRRYIKICVLALPDPGRVASFTTYFDISPRVFIRFSISWAFWNQWFFADFNFFAIFHSEHFEKSHYNGLPHIFRGHAKGGFWNQWTK